MSDQLDPKSLLELTALIVVAQVENNTTAAQDVPSLIRSVYQSVAGLGSQPAASAKPEPAVAIKKSVFPSHIVCLECGKSLKMLKKHLKTDHGLTPADYRARWELPSTYPIVAPEYAERRSAMAKGLGFGRGRKVVAPVAEATPAKVAAKRGRKPGPAK
jgi:predicted transcriptional regulator